MVFVLALEVPGVTAALEVLELELAPSVNSGDSKFESFLLNNEPRANLAAVPAVPLLTVSSLRLPVAGWACPGLRPGGPCIGSPGISGTFGRLWIEVQRRKLPRIPVDCCTLT